MEPNKPLHPEDGSQETRNTHEEERRQRILTAADEQFRLYGYNKTTMADLSRSIGVSAGYIYIFFKSKQAVGEAICDRCLTKIADELERIANEPGSAAERLRRVYEELVRQSKNLFFEERKLHDIVRVAITEKWSVVPRHEVRLRAIMRKLVIDGRESGEFDRKTPPDEICRAIMQTLLPFVHPVLLEERLDEIELNAASVAGLVLRSLAR
jgi:AcrR family transcriptional regulator